MVGGEAGPGQQKQLRSELQRHDQADGRGVVMGQLGGPQPVLGRPLHPCADMGDEGAGDPDPIIEASQRPEDTRNGSLHGCSGALPPLKRPNCRAANSASSNAPAPNAATSPMSFNSKSPTRQTST